VWANGPKEISMAISGAQITFGTTPVQIKSVAPPSVKQLDIMASTSNNDNVYLGSSAVATTPANCWGILQPGKSWGTQAQEDNQVIVGEDLYIIGTEGEAAHLIWVAF
jgi:hypothetical protein